MQESAAQGMDDDPDLSFVPGCRLRCGSQSCGIRQASNGGDTAEGKAVPFRMAPVAGMRSSPGESVRLLLPASAPVVRGVLAMVGSPLPVARSEPRVFLTRRRCVLHARRKGIANQPLNRLPPGERVLNYSHTSKISQAGQGPLIAESPRPIP